MEASWIATEIEGWEIYEWVKRWRNGESVDGWTDG